MSWTDERVDVLRQMWLDGSSSGQIAEHLGVTRNMVMGKISRLGLMGQGGVVRKPKRRRVYPARKPMLVKEKTVEQPAPVVVPPPLADPVAMLGPSGDPRGGLQPLQCRWPVSGEGAEMLFCGRQTPGYGESYCTGHAQLARPTSAQRRASAARRAFLKRPSARVVGMMRFT